MYTIKLYSGNSAKFGSTESLVALHMPKMLSRLVLGASGSTLQAVKTGCDIKWLDKI